MKIKFDLMIGRVTSASDYCMKNYYIDLILGGNAHQKKLKGYGLPTLEKELEPPP